MPPKKADSRASLILFQVILPLLVALSLCTLTFATSGAKTLTASYAGDAYFTGSISAGVGHQVNPISASTTTTLVSSQNPSIVNGAVTFTANVSPTPTGGTVAFKEGGAAISGCGARPLTAGQATCTTAALTVKVHRITAAYSGDANYNLSSSDALYQGVHARPAVGAGLYHTCGLKADGTLACWGRNDYGQSNVPTPNSNWVQVVAGWLHTCGLQADGTLACWGDNDYGQTAVPSNPHWVQVSASVLHTCGLKADGTLACWGYNYYGEATVPSNPNWMQVSAGGLHTCGLKADGTLVCWGWNYFAQTDVPVERELGAGQRGRGSHLRAESRWHARLLGLQSRRTNRRAIEPELGAGQCGRQSHLRAESRWHACLLG